MTKGTRPADAVVILARLRVSDGCSRVLLVKQFRPPLAAVSVELPAGLVDAGESLRDAALRELREETGFVGVTTKTHPTASLSLGMFVETVAMVEVDVQGAAREQKLDAVESITGVFLEAMLERFESAYRRVDFAVLFGGVLKESDSSSQATAIVQRGSKREQYDATSTRNDVWLCC